MGNGGVLAVDGAIVDDPLGPFEAELEGEVAPGRALEAGAVELATVGPEEEIEIGKGDLRITLFEGEGIVAVLLEDKGTLVLGVAVPLEAGTVVAFTTKGCTVSVVVICSKAVPEIVASI